MLRTNYQKAVALMLVSAFGFALMLIAIRLAGDLPSLQKVFFRNLIPILISACVLIQQYFKKRTSKAKSLPKLTVLAKSNATFEASATRTSAATTTDTTTTDTIDTTATSATLPLSNPRKAKRKKVALILFLRCLAGTIGAVLNFYAIDHLAATEASVIFKTMPIFIVILCFIFLHESVRLKEIYALILALIGIVVIAYGDVLEAYWHYFLTKQLSTLPTPPSFSSLHAYLISFLAAILAACAYTCVRALGRYQVNSSLIILSFSTFSTVTIGLCLLKYHQAMSLTQLGYLALAGIGASLGQYGLTLAYKLAPPAEISLYDYSNVLFSTLLAMLILNEYPTASALVGAGIIFVALFLAWLVKRQELKCSYN